ncbi:MAG: hypothetical protein D6781_14710, partial [Verrucomicrobia bacterium]
MWSTGCSTFAPAWKPTSTSRRKTCRPRSGSREFRKWIRFVRIWTGFAERCARERCSRRACG